MKSKRSEQEQRYLLLFKLDAQSLYMRIRERREDYIHVFSAKRDRHIFSEVFENRYQKANIEDLSHCSIEVIESLNNFYQQVDKLFWYLKHTQDMPNMIEDEIDRHLILLKRSYETLQLYIDAELAGEVESSEISIPDFSDLDEFSLKGEQ